MQSTNSAPAVLRHWVLSLLVSTSAGLASAQDQSTTVPPPPPPEPAVAAPAPLDPKLPTLFIAGDSTAASNGGGAVGWGVPFPSFFDTTKINVANRARGGRSSRTFITEGLWDKLLADVKQGDFVLIQFGHNDPGAINEEPPGSKAPLRARGSLAGLGEESKEIDNVITKKHEVVHTYGWYMRRMINDARAKGARPVVLSLTVRNIWKDGKVERGPGEYGQWSAEIAKKEGVAFIDLTTIIAEQYEKMGEETAKKFFPRDHTHTNGDGAELNAASVVAMLKAGDFVMMQFGTNDNGALNDTSRARGTIKGVGEETEAIDNLLTRQHEVVHSYGWYLRKFIADARARGATPIMCSLVPRKIWKDGKIVRSKDDYAGWAEQVAKAEGAAFVDLNEIIARRYDALGQEKVEPLFADPHTHTSAVGAELGAQSAIAGLKGLKDNPLAAFFSAKAADVVAYLP
jgi:lysophospholipase L1-like esterase